ncbi:unnamed protein product, partial [Symbiodinium pilosum]
MTLASLRSSCLLAYRLTHSYLARAPHIKRGLHSYPSSPHLAYSTGDDAAG